MASSPSVEHPSLGQILGTKTPRHEHVDQYLGIQYATLANRFARGTLVETPTSSTPTTATKIGPLPVANPENCALEHLLIQHALPFEEFQFSDTECLTLNVSVPAAGGARVSKEPLPVVAFVHGGGFVTGSANWPQYDLATLVERSVQIGKPVIAVGINYRLGPFGFLSSSAMREAGFLPNNGLHDQKLALCWIKKHIGGFGGDPEQVTFLGSSIGAASGFIHLQSDEPLFANLVALGGNALIQPLPPAVSEIAFSGAISVLGLAQLSPAEQVQSLLSMPAQELSAKLNNVPLPLNAYLDNDIVKEIPSYTSTTQFAAGKNSLFPGTKWCKTVLLGDSQIDGMIMDVTVLSHRPDNLAETLTRSLAAVFADPSSVPDALTKAYGIDPSQPKDKLPVLHFINDIIFAQGAKAIAQAFAQIQDEKVYLSHFNLPNPWQGPWKGHASHALDIVILLGTFNDFLGPGQKACAQHMTDDFLRLAHGEEPFPPFSDGEQAMVYFAEEQGDKDESKLVKEVDPSLTGRRRILDEVAAGRPEVLDQLLAAFGLFMQGGPK